MKHSLVLDSCPTPSSLRFNLIAGGAGIGEHKKFDFDIRYYRPYTGNKLVGSGLYVFKTEDQNSLPYQHTIVSIEIFRGERTQQMLIRYLNKEGEYSIVKVRLIPESKDIEFDVQLARVPTKGNQGMDITVNWSNLHESNSGIFFTDANSFKVVRNDVT